MTKEKISDLIETTLGFTNGWRISDEDYKMHCDDIAEQIVKNCSIPNVVGQSEQYFCCKEQIEQRCNEQCLGCFQFENK